MLASRFKERRKSLSLSQTELASGICEQGQISRIEKGKYVPNSDLLFKLSKRLGVSLDYFYDTTIKLEVPKLNKFKELVEIFLETHEYESIQYLYHSEIAKNQQYIYSEQIYLTWIKAILLFYCEEKTKEATELLESVLKEMSPEELDYLNIKNTLLNFALEKGENEKVDNLYHSLKNKIRDIDLNNLNNLKIYIKIRYNYCRQLWLSNRGDDALKEILETIQVCDAHQSKYLLANLYCLLGNVSEEFYDRSAVKKYFQISQLLFSLSNNEKMALEIGKHLYENYQDN